MRAAKTARPSKGSGSQHGGRREIGRGAQIVFKTKGRFLLMRSPTLRSTWTPPVVSAVVIPCRHFRQAEFHIDAMEG